MHGKHKKQATPEEPHQFRPCKEQKKCYRCGHTEEEHHRGVDDGAGVLWFCRVKGCSCDHFIGNANDYIRSTRGAAEESIGVFCQILVRYLEEFRPREVFVSFRSFSSVAEFGHPDTNGEDLRINPKDVSSVSTFRGALVQVSMRNKQIWLVKGTVDEVQKKLQEA
jgi:hypothetical protein